MNKKSNFHCTTRCDKCLVKWNFSNSSKMLNQKSNVSGRSETNRTNLILQTFLYLCTLLHLFTFRHLSKSKTYPLYQTYTLGKPLNVKTNLGNNKNTTNLTNKKKEIIEESNSKNQYNIKCGRKEREKATKKHPKTNKKSKEKGEEAPELRGKWKEEKEM